MRIAQVLLQMHSMATQHRAKQDMGAVCVFFCVFFTLADRVSESVCITSTDWIIGQRGNPPK